jgi:hypothetical protein
VWSASAPQSATGPRLPNLSERKNLNSSVPGAAAPGNLASISSEAADSRRDAPTVLPLAGTSHTSVRGDLSPLEYRNDQPSPEGGARPPPLGGYRHYCPCPLGGGGGARSAGGVGGLLQSITSSPSGENRGEERTCATWVASTQYYLLICALIGSFLEKGLYRGTYYHLSTVKTVEYLKVGSCGWEKPAKTDFERGSPPK